jgi:hypothetical protein
MMSTNRKQQPSRIFTLYTNMLMINVNKSVLFGPSSTLLFGAIAVNSIVVRRATLFTVRGKDDKTLDQRHRFSLATRAGPTNRSEVEETPNRRAKPGLNYPTFDYPFWSIELVPAVVFFFLLLKNDLIDALELPCDLKGVV